MVNQNLVILARIHEKFHTARHGGRSSYRFMGL